MINFGGTILYRRFRLELDRHHGRFCLSLHQRQDGQRMQCFDVGQLEDTLRGCADWCVHRSRSSRSWRRKQRGEHQGQCRRDQETNCEPTYKWRPYIVCTFDENSSSELGGLKPGAFGEVKPPNKFVMFPSITVRSGKAAPNHAINFHCFYVEYQLQ